jgi:hypothetical protein
MFLDERGESIRERSKTESGWREKKKEEMNKKSENKINRPMLYGVREPTNIRSIRQSKLTLLWPIFGLLGPDLCSFLHCFCLFIFFLYYFIQLFCFCSFYPNSKK